MVAHGRETVLERFTSKAPTWEGVWTASAGACRRSNGTDDGSPAEIYLNFGIFVHAPRLAELFTHALMKAMPVQPSSMFA